MGNASIAKGLRRDLERAFVWACEQGDESVPAEGSERWDELFENGAHTKRVDFHSFRRSYVQALASAGVSTQDAAALAGHASLESHVRYLVNTTRPRELPKAAMPELGQLDSRPAEEYTIPKKESEPVPANPSEIRGTRGAIRTPDRRLRRPTIIT